MRTTSDGALYNANSKKILTQHAGAPITEPLFVRKKRMGNACRPYEVISHGSDDPSMTRTFIKAEYCCNDTMPCGASNLCLPIIHKSVDRQVHCDHACPQSTKCIEDHQRCCGQSSRNTQMVLPEDEDVNLFVHSAAWGEGSGDVIVIKMHVRRRNMIDEVDIKRYNLWPDNKAKVELVVRGAPGLTCDLVFGNGLRIGSIDLVEDFRIYHFDLDVDKNLSISDTRQLFLDVHGVGDMIIDKTHGLLVSGADVLPYINGPNMFAARQGILKSPYRYTCESAIEIKLKANSGKEQMRVFMNGTRTPLEARFFEPKKNQWRTLRYSICPLNFPIMSLEFHMRFPGEDDPRPGRGVQISYVKVNGYNCLKSAVFYPPGGVEDDNEIVVGTSVGSGEWNQEGWYRIMCYRRLNKRHCSPMDPIF